jgi:3-oxoacyl-[acyl-carrier protein] reductase
VKSQLHLLTDRENRDERKEQSNKLGSEDIAHTIISIVEMRNKGFIPEVTIWATNPFE